MARLLPKNGQYQLQRWLILGGRGGDGRSCPDKSCYLFQAPFAVNVAAAPPAGLFFSAHHRSILVGQWPVLRNKLPARPLNALLFFGIPPANILLVAQV
ncbi:uncharacterized protein [Drosophila kikkawai]